MATTEPVAENVTDQYDDDEMQTRDAEAVIPWAEGLELLSGTFSYWLATVRGGRPHVRPVLAVWVDGLMCTTSNPGKQKARNLAANPSCSFTTSAGGIDFVVEGTAAAVTDPDLLERIAAAYHDKYQWPVRIVDGAFTAPYGAPAAGPPPYQPFAVTPTTIYGFGTTEELGPRSTRWRF